MRKMNSVVKTMGLLAATAAVGALVMGENWGAQRGQIGAAAWAQEGTGQDTGTGKQGGQGQGSKGAQNGQGTNEGKGQGQGGPSSDSDAKGPHAGSPSSSGGGKPVWAQEGIPEVELGRLNVVRSPDHVLQRAYDEAIASISPEMVSFYNLTLDQVIEQLSLNFDSTAYIDSPLQNLALLRDMLDGESKLSAMGVTSSTQQLEAIFLGVASDKTVPITADSVIAVTTILGTPVTGAAAEKLAADAESIRIAVLAGHG
ncbi:MAG: hypothetical protein GC186_15135 [Rhodobacteraceae bacterium]|nr:hypothetical protein [Paracoccaceae bacterium]